MSTVALILILISSIAHALWNLYAKRNEPSLPMFLLANLAGAAICLPGLLMHCQALARFTPEIWGLMVCTGLFQAIYCCGLALSYRSGEISRAYPVARAVPVVAVAAVSLAAGVAIGPAALTGMVIVVAGCLLIPTDRLQDLRLSSYRRPWLLYALTAALGTAGYTILDDRCLRLIREVSGLSPVRAAVVFLVFDTFVSFLWLSLFVSCRRADRRQLGELLRVGKFRCVRLGAAMYLTYLMVLTAMGYASDVSYIAAMRQLSIPLGAALGVVVLGESASRTKQLGIAVTCAGLLLVSLS
ncbi:MAG: hypothetical protein VB858_07515 [Planctomycetaceae bacterium]